MQSRAGKRAWDGTPDLTSQWAPSLPRWSANPAQYDKPSNQSYLGSFVEGERLERKMQILDTRGRMGTIIGGAPSGARQPAT